MAIELLTPRGISKSPQNPIAPRLDTLDGKVLGLIDNSKDNADLFLDAVAGLLEQSYRIPQTLRLQKPNGSVPVSFTREFFDKCDYVINAFGD